MANIKIEAISSFIKEQIKKYRDLPETEETGTVVEVGDGIALIYGLDKAMNGELLSFPRHVTGMVLNLETDCVGAILFGDADSIKEGDKVKRTGRILEVPVGEELLGRVIDSIGHPLDGKGPLNAKKHRPVEKKATDVMSRQSVREPLQTGLKAIDALIPIGRGQRELIIGDRQTGKTALAIDTIINQRDQNVICIYVAIGQKESTVADVAETLRRYHALNYTVIVSAAASNPAPLLYLAPYTGVTIGEEFMFAGRDVLIVYDDLSKHAVSYRELSLLLKRSPGREAYPGDIFYLHSRLLERSAKLATELGGGSLTALPIVETQAGDISAYIPTNIISITDGQIFLESSLFYTGVRPAINPGLSVSRVGGNAQIKAIKNLSGTLRIDLASYRELEAFTQFGSDLDEITKAKLERGKRTVEILKQDLHHPLAAEKQAVLLFALVNGFIDKIPIERIGAFEESLFYKLDNDPSGIKITGEIRQRKDIIAPERLEEFLNEFLGEF